MKILVISQYFYPENFRINDLDFSLKERGHQVEVLTGKPIIQKEINEGYSMVLMKRKLMGSKSTEPI